MSHFTRIQTQISDKTHLLQALHDMGFQFEDAPQNLRGFRGQKTMVDIRIKLENSYDVGFQKVGDVFEAIADWSRVRGLEQEKFINQVSQRYAYHAAKAKLTEQGFTLVEEQTTNNGQIHMVLRRLSS